MTALLSVSPAQEGSIAKEVASAIDALNDYNVKYETNAMCTVIEAEELSELLDAVAAAHNAVDAERVSTLLKIDDKRSGGGAREKVESVRKQLGREPSSSSETELS